MKRASSVIFLIPFLAVSTFSGFRANAQNEVSFRHIPSSEEIEARINLNEIKVDTIQLPQIDSTAFIVRDLDEIIASIGEPTIKPLIKNRHFAPWVFSGYKKIAKKRLDPEEIFQLRGLKVINGDVAAADSLLLEEGQLIDGNDTIAIVSEQLTTDVMTTTESMDINNMQYTPKWLRDALTINRLQDDMMYEAMILNPYNIDYAYWNLPERPRLPEDEVSFSAYIRKLDLPEIDPEKVELPDEDLRRIYWLHRVNTGLQFSQAFVSQNWYQGGNNHLALLFNFNWDVQLNQVYYPNFLFQSSFGYKLGMNSTPQDEVHDYSISEDLLQYNLNAGLKAFKKWFYSFNLMFKTQLLRNYEKNSMVRKASFLSPGDLNIGLGMSYSTTNKKKTFQLTATVSPISYNLKTCISDKVDHGRFNIAPDRKAHSEIGSNGEVNMTWRLAWNIEYKSRLFLFTDYKYFLSDWEHTVSFNINKFLSTQIYAHMRYDTSVPSNTSWKKFMLREVLSFGLSYTFSTKP